MESVSLIEGADDAGIADWLADRLGGAFLADGPVTITVPGGTTPFPIIENLIARDMPWHRLVVWPNDDRAVPEAHSASNTGKLRALFERVGAEVVTLTVMEQVPRFAFSWIGMGADGHTASLFPKADPRIDDERAMVRITPDPLPPEAPFDRISLTLPSLLNSAELLLVARGTDKRAVLDRVLAGDGDTADLPIARLLGAAPGPVTVFV